MGEQTIVLMVKKIKPPELRLLHLGTLTEHEEPMNCPHVLLQHELKQKAGLLSANNLLILCTVKLLMLHATKACDAASLKAKKSSPKNVQSTS